MCRCSGILESNNAVNIDYLNTEVNYTIATCRCSGILESNNAVNIDYLNTEVNYTIATCRCSGILESNRKHRLFKYRGKLHNSNVSL